MNESKKQPGKIATTFGFLVIFGVIALVIGGAVALFSAHAKPKNNTTATTNTAKTTATTTPQTNSTPASTAVVLTGFGATQAEWNKSHTAAKNFSSDSSYNPNPSVTASCNGVKYCSMNWTGGRALDYTIGFPSNVSQSVAQATVMQEFPSDATVVWQERNTSGAPNECYQMEIQSPTLAKALSNNGQAFVEFSTLVPSDTSGNIDYNAANITEAILQDLPYASASEAPGC